MKWRKRGIVWRPDGKLVWASSHAMLPTPVRLPDGRLRLLIACADATIVSRIGWIDIAREDPARVTAQSDTPVLDIGEAGMFDDNGVNPACVVPLNGGLRLYYVGYQLQRKIPYTLFTGIAQGPLDASGFRRLAPTPVLDRGPTEPFFRTAPFVMRDDDSWRVWYIAGGGWTEIDGKVQPIYGLRHARSPDGITWPDAGESCLEPRLPEEIGFGRPWVIRATSGWRMWYSIRGRRGYRLGYSTSPDGVAWTRRDDEVGIATSTLGWDNEMICYAAIVPVHDTLAMFYNGNGYGRTGVGVAMLEHD